MGGNQLVLVKSIRQMLFFVCFLITIFHLLPFFPHFAPAAAAMEPGEGPRPPQARGDGDVPTDPRPGEGVFFWGGGGNPKKMGKTCVRRWCSAENALPWWRNSGQRGRPPARPEKQRPGDGLLPGILLRGGQNTIREMFSCMTVPSGVQ